MAARLQAAVLVLVRPQVCDIRPCRFILRISNDQQQNRWRSHARGEFASGFGFDYIGDILVLANFRQKTPT